MNGTEIATVEGTTQLVPMSMARMKEEVILIDELMKDVMVKDEHWGIIPGVEKPSLYKPGAEKLDKIFHLRPKYTILECTVNSELVYYRIMCELINYLNGLVVGECIASANSREEKWRYTNITTNEPVPKNYWSSREKGDTATMKEIMGEDGVPKKKGNSWFIARRMENMNAYDKDNTICKMAQKRAMVGATLTACAASDIFTQDVEDMKIDVADDTQPPEPPAEKKPAAKKPAAKKPAPERTPLKATTKGGAAIADYDMAVDLFKKIDYTKEAVANFLENIDILVPSSCESPLYDIVDDEQMGFILEELKGMILDAKNYEKTANEDGAPLPLDG